jgi:hypothetical protein
MGYFAVATDSWIGVTLVVYPGDTDFLSVDQTSDLDLLGLGLSGFAVDSLGLCTEQSLTSLCDGTALCEIFSLIIS